MLPWMNRSGIQETPDFAPSLHPGYTADISLNFNCGTRILYFLPKSEGINPEASSSLTMLLS
jgi:hypothetical protein